MNDDYECGCGGHTQFFLPTYSLGHYITENDHFSATGF